MRAFTRALYTPSVRSTRRFTMASHAAHYDAVAEAYGDAEFYRRGAYRDWQVGLVRAALGDATGAVADIGGGDGAFARDVLPAATFLEVVEPSAAMADSAPAPAIAANTVFSRRDAAAWAAADDDGDRRAFDAVLLKEVVHHVGDRAAFWAAARANRVASRGRVVVVTRPATAIDYPLWDAARDVWAANQPAEETLTSELAAAGFADVAATLEAYPMKMPLDRWLSLVRGRVWSTFSHFTDAELDAAVESVRRRETRSDGLVEFEERLVVIVARNAA